MRERERQNRDARAVTREGGDNMRCSLANLRQTDMCCVRALAKPQTDVCHPISAVSEARKLAGRVLICFPP